MKKITLSLIVVSAVFLLGLNVAGEQNFAYVDSEYILNKVPAYDQAQKKLDQLSEGWEAEIEAKYKEVEKMYSEFQAEQALLLDDIKRKREEAIIAKEKEAKALQKKYFGRDGELQKKQTELIKPIQDEVFNAVKELASEGGYALVFDSSTGGNILYSDDKYDKSDDVLKKLGY